MLYTIICVRNGVNVEEFIGTMVELTSLFIHTITHAYNVQKEYLKRKQLKVSILDRGTAWLDTGTFASLMQAGQFVQVIEERQGLKIGAIEEAAYKMGFINADQLKRLAAPLLKSGYGIHLLSLI